MSQRSIVAVALSMVAALATSAMVLGQDEAQTEPGSLYFLPDIVRETQDDACGNVPTYNTTHTLEPFNESQELPLAFSSAVDSCATQFNHAVRIPFVLTGNATARYWIQCTAAHDADPVLESFGYQLARNGEPVDDVHFVADTIGACADDVVEIEHDGIPTGDTAFEEGDNLTLSIWAYAGPHVPGTLDNLHVLAGSLEHPSTLNATGLPEGTIVGQEPEGGLAELEMTSVNATAQTVAGQTTTFDLSVRNAGNHAAAVEFSTTGLPAGFSAQFQPHGAELAANESADVRLIVEVPQDAQTGEHAFEAHAEAMANGSASTQLLLVVEESTNGGQGGTGDGTPAPSPAPDGDEDYVQDGNASGPNGTGDGAGAPGLGLATAVLGVSVAAAAAWRRRG